MTEGENPEPVKYASIAIEENKDARMWGMFCHLSALAGFMIPFGNIIGPLIIWLIKKDEFPFVDDQGKESLNFQITVSIAGVVCFIFSLLLFCIGIPMAMGVAVASLVFIIMATVAANKGEPYRYPVSIRFIK